MDGLSCWPGLENALEKAHERTRLKMRAKRLAKLHGKRPSIRQGRIREAREPQPVMGGWRVPPNQLWEGFDL